MFIYLLKYSLLGVKSKYKECFCFDVPARNVCQQKIRMKELCNDHQTLFVDVTHNNALCV